MCWNGRQAQIATPTNHKQLSNNNRSHCSQCRCQEFLSDVTVISAVESDERTEALISWLSGGASSSIVTTKSGDSEGISSDTTHRCPSRLRASIAILNAIRDACRLHLETSSSAATSSSPTVRSSSCGTMAADGKQHVEEPTYFNDRATYEDSFPSLSSLSATAPLTVLVGRKKNKVVPKKGNNDSTNKVSSSNSNATISKTAKNNTSLRIDIAHTPKVKAKKRIKPVTISLSNESYPKSGNYTTTSNNGSETVMKVKGNVSSLPSQDTNDLSVTKSIQNLNYNTDEEITIVESCNVLSSKRLVLIYSTILRSQLVPSLLMEFHLLVRLLSLSDRRCNLNNNTTNVGGNDEVQQSFSYGAIFQSYQSCRVFAAETLIAMESILVNLGHSTIKMFVELPSLHRQCPELYMTLQDVINAGNTSLLFESDQKALGCNTNIPHLTLPFDQAHDSRHNFRSVDLSRMFKEREGLRDTFLYQLRAFQDVRGRLLEDDEAEKNISSLKYASREMLLNISPDNIMWFVNFFCDLLLQIGLSPISETDSEVLKQIGDKKRLQKLHMRFTSKAGRADKSSRKLRIDDKGSSSSATKFSPEHNFPGHQEFFAIFLQASESHKFNSHLKHRLGQFMSDMMLVNEIKGLCIHIAKTQMVAKFLGIIVFSPNYGIPGDSISSIREEIPVIDILDCIGAAWNQRRLVIVIPWVVQFLGMMKWDQISRRFRYYVDSFALLWSIRYYCLPYQMSHHSHHQTNMMTIFFQLEYLFHDVFGLAASQTMPLRNLSIQETSGTVEPSAFVPFDDLPLWFSNTSLFPSIPHLKDLCELLRELAQSDGKIVMTAAKKVRPDTVSNFTGNDSRFVSRISYSIDSGVSPWSSKRPGSPINKGGIKERLIDAFFHQAKEMQQICEIVVDRVMKNFIQTVSHACILPLFRNGATSFEEYLDKVPSMTLHDYSTLLENLDSMAKIEANAMMNSDMNRIINDTVVLLAPSDTKSKVIQVAIALTIAHATEKGTSTIHSIIREEKKKLIDEFVKKEKKLKAGVPLFAFKKPTVERDHLHSNDSNLNCLIDLTKSLRVLHKSNVSLSFENGIERLREQKEHVLDYLKHFVLGNGDFWAVMDFENCVLSLLRDFFASPSHSSLILASIIEVSDALSLLSKMGYSESSMEVESLVCDSNNMLTMISAVDDGIISSESIGNFMFVMLDGSLVSSQALETALLHVLTVKEDARYVCIALLCRLSPGKAQIRSTGVDLPDGLVVMVRLQRFLQGISPYVNHLLE